MNVQQLREALQAMPDHLPVMLAVRGGDATRKDLAHWCEGVDFIFSLDCKVEAFPTFGRMAVVYADHEPR